jgi:hypothetical protein
MRWHASRTAEAMLRRVARVRFMNTSADGGSPAYRFQDLYTTNHLSLPRLPIPDLDATLNNYVESLKPVTEPTALEAHCKLVEEFRANEGPALQKQLLEVDKQLGRSQTYPYHYVEKYWDDMYLELRCPLPVNVAPGYGLRPDADCGTDRALLRMAKFIAATFRWQHKVLAGQLEPSVQTLGCMSFLSRLMGTARVPKKGRDELFFNPASTHVAVLCSGRIFRVDVLSKDRSSMLTVDELHQQLKTILRSGPSSSTAHDAGLPLGLLTREDRDVWAGLRSRLERHSTNNRERLKEVDAALFVVCLDQQEPSSPTQRSQDLLHGRPGELGNRWYDKMQVIWSPAGTISVCFEHTYSDGIVWNRWLGDVWDHMQGVFRAPMRLRVHARSCCTCCEFSTCHCRICFVVSHDTHLHAYARALQYTHANAHCRSCVALFLPSSTPSNRAPTGTT